MRNKEVEIVIRTLPTKTIPGPDEFAAQFCQTSKDVQPILQALYFNFILLGLLNASTSLPIPQPQVGKKEGQKGQGTQTSLALVPAGQGWQILWKNTNLSCQDIQQSSRTWKWQSLKEEQADFFLLCLLEAFSSLSGL